MGHFGQVDRCDDQDASGTLGFRRRVLPDMKLTKMRADADVACVARWVCRYRTV